MKINTHINRLLVCGLLLLSFAMSSCSEWLDVKPKSEIKGTELFKTEQGFEDAMMGVYILMTDARLYGRELSFGMIEALAQQYELDQTQSTYREVVQYQYESQDVIAKVDNIWSAAYNVLANINYILKNLDTYRENVTPPVYDRIKGECLGLRAFIHFDLLRMFGWGDLKNRPEMMGRLSIPYATRYTKDLIPQVTVKEALDYAIADLNEAEKLIPPSSTASRFTFTYYAVLATHMRIAMWQGDYATARRYAETLLTFEEDFPWVTVSSLPNNNPQGRDITFSSEYIFGLNIENFNEITEPFFEQRLDEQVNNQFLYRSATKVDDLYQVREEIGMGDYRLYFFDRIGLQYPFLKYKQYENGSYKNRVPLMKKAEIYYTLAECLNASGDAADRREAIQYLNTVRTKRNIIQPLSNDLNQEEVQKELTREWRKETILEGQMFFYYKRLGMVNIIEKGVVMDDKNYVLPIPLDEIEFGGRENNRN